jgi:hypothetical protein
MSDEPRKGSRIRIFWAALVALLPLYPLSMGPVLWVALWATAEYDNHYILRDAVRIYRPLMTAADAVHPFFVALNPPLE